MKPSDDLPDPVSASDQVRGARDAAVTIARLKKPCVGLRGTLKDPAGNRLGGHFETSIYSPPGRPVDAVLPFSVGTSRRQATDQQ